MAAEDVRVVVLMGGFSSEREISLVSGKSALSALREEGFPASGIDITGPDEAGLGRELERHRPCAAFIALHGAYGEDGKIQECLERIGIPYTGSGVLSSAVCFNKFISKRVLESFKVPVPPCVLVCGGYGPESARSEFGFPLVVKPVSSGSAIGITLADNQAELEAGIAAASAAGGRVMIEKYVAGRELTVSILGSRSPEVLPIIEIQTEEKFYNYNAKYVPGLSRHILPAPLEPAEKRAVEKTALLVYRVLGCEGFARVDLILSEKGIPYVLDVNTIPGLTGTSLFPEAAGAAGIGLGGLCRTLIGLALERR